jgi:hypothetical protein
LGWERTAELGWGMALIRVKLTPKQSFEHHYRNR